MFERYEDKYYEDEIEEAGEEKNALLDGKDISLNEDFSLDYHSRHFSTAVAAEFLYQLTSSFLLRALFNYSINFHS